QDGLGDGDTSPDWTEPVIDQNNGIITLKLRAERSGKGKGRIYTITITATDQSGNSNQGKVEIRVPHSQGKK
ncbi:MAG: HYR domain-containing protein, partial [Thermodesulfobacteriota bacterium]